MGNAIQSALSLIINTVFDFFLFVVLLRFLLQLTRADFYNPLSQFVVKLTNPVLRPLRKVIPGLGGIDMASLLLAFLVAFIKRGLLFSLVLGLTPHPIGLMLFAIADIIGTLIYIYFMAIIAQVILSWISQGQYNPFMAIIFNLTEPLMSRVRRVIPPIAGIDLSPIPVLIGLQLVNILVVGPLMALGSQFILG
jgi:YggT family protein